MKTSLLFLVFAILVVSCKKKETVIPAALYQFKGISIDSCNKRIYYLNQKDTMITVFDWQDITGCTDEEYAKKFVSNSTKDWHITSTRHDTVCYQFSKYEYRRKP